MRVWKKRLSILLVCQLFLAGTLWAHSYHREASRAQTTDLLTLEIDSIDKIEIFEGETSFTLVRSNGQWSLPGYYDLSATQSGVERLLNGLDELTARAPETTTKSSHERLGVSEGTPEGRLKLYSGEQLVGDLMLGKTPTLNQRYLRLAGQVDTFRTPWQGLNVQAQGRAWLDRKLLASGSLTKFVHPEFELVQENGEWKSGETPLDQNKVQDLVSHLQKLVVIDATDELSPDQTLDFVVQNSEGTEYTYSYFEESNKHYLMRNDHDLAFQVGESIGKKFSTVDIESLTKSEKET